MRYTGISLFIFILLSTSACTTETESSVDKNAAQSNFRAINNNDTATLNITLNQKGFYGQLEINHRGLFKDSGDVNGVLKGDTLMGTFHYQSYGIDQKYRIPIALLKNKNQLIMGNGKMIIKMNMTFFAKEVPIDYKNPLFVFEKKE